MALLEDRSITFAAQQHARSPLAVEEMPEMSEVFLRYRDLKKQLKRMPHTDSSSNLTGGEILG